MIRFITLLLWLACFSCISEEQSLRQLIKLNDININGMEFHDVYATKKNTQLKINGSIKLSGIKTLPDGYVEIALEMKEQASEIVMVCIKRKKLSSTYWSHGRLQTRYIRNVNFSSDINNISSELVSITVSFIELASKENSIQ
ncbi:MAG: hypothetical protein PWP74_558 [Shewanella sp.]|nr:hypothetical protein [Shewanella sp.]